MDTTPPTSTNSAITHAKMGRSMKNLAMVGGPQRLAAEAGTEGAAADAAEAGAAAPILPENGTGLTGAPGRIF
jgi:hypothetical protein